MGLNAIVYRNVKKFPKEVDLGALSVDLITGEAYFEDDKLARNYPAETFQATSCRLGNMGALIEILEEISHLLPRDSVLRSKILNSFSHCGDVIAGEDLNMLDQEIYLLRNRTEGKRSNALTEFLNALEQLIKTAREQRNPIVFV